MINWMLEVEDVEDVDVACTVDGMEAMDRSQYLVQRGKGGNEDPGYELMRHLFRVSY
jgi:hypothetical protein